MATGWTIETLKEYFEAILAERDKALNAALASAKEAVGVAEKNAEKWRDNANEWRGAMNDKDKNLLSRSEFLNYKESAEKAQIIEKERNDKSEGRSDGYSKFIGWIIAGITIAAFVITHFNK